ncbi:MAG: YdcF family protein [Acidobacteria bacterium]|nr:YdcF family protein [Acidobacteriota bacterium]
MAVAAWRKSRKLALFASLFLLLWSLPAVSDPLLKTLEDRYPRILPAAAPTASAIVVLSGGLHDPAPGRPLDWNFAVNRFERGLDLYRAARAPIVVFTGGIDVLNGRSPARPMTEADYLRDAAIARGVPPSAILTTSDVRNTQGEAAAVAGLAAKNRWSRILLVTSAFHLPRAVFLFKRAGVDVVPFPAGHLTQDPALHPEFDPLRYLPDPEALRNSHFAFREYIGIGYYQFIHR